MRKIVLTICSVLFLANTVTVMAWANPCLMSKAQTQSEDMIPSMESSQDMPCHNSTDDMKADTSEHSKDNKTKHCSGICLCLHAALTVVQDLPHKSHMTFMSLDSDLIWHTDKIMASTVDKPPLDPPKLIS